MSSKARDNKPSFNSSNTPGKSNLETAPSEHLLDANDTEAQLRALLVSIVDSSADAILSIALDGRLLSWNAAAAKIFGYSAEAIIGCPVSTLAFPEQVAEQKQLIEKSKGGVPVTNFETVRRRKDGSAFDVSMTLSPIRDKAGNISLISSILRDITPNKQAARALEEANRQYSVILESINDAFYALDARECFTWVNRKALELWGKTGEDLTGKNFWEVFPDLKGLPVYQHLHLAWTEQVSVEFEIYSQFLQRWVEGVVYPTGGGGVSSYFRNISARKEAERVNRENEQRYRILAENVSDLVIRTRPNSRFEYVSPSSQVLLGYEPEELLGLGPFD